MKVGFTGTRDGLWWLQSCAIFELLRQIPTEEAHHGDCVGADADFHRIAFNANMSVRRIGHPPTDERFRAFCCFDEEREPKPYLERNRRIVDECDVLIAAPKTMEPPPSLRGEGTWSTYFYARDRAKKPVYLVLPDGTVRPENI